MGSQPHLQSLREFQRATSGGVFRGRDELEPLDYALSQLEEYGATMSSADRLQMLHFALKAGRDWLASKQTKLANNATALVRKREAAIKTLLDQMGDQYRMESFRANKGRGRLDQTQGMELKGLAGNYIFEATAQPKGVAHPSASNVLHYAEQQGMAVRHKEGYIAARDAYLADDNRGGATEQLYYNRAARMRYLLLMKKGKLWTDPTTLADLNGAYAMDEYGNLFAQETPDGDRAFNHSSFCRGKQVACAGIIHVVAGEIASINNMSGHYKPGANQLANALRILLANGLDLAQTAVMCALGPGTTADRKHCGVHLKPEDCLQAPTPFMKVVFAKGSTFLASPSGNGLPIVDPKTFKSSADAKAAENTPHIEFNHVA